MDKQTTKEVIAQIYKDIDGFEISKKAVQQLDHYYLAYEYGEATFDSFYSLLYQLDVKPGQVFYDLGSGVGNKVISAALGFGLVSYGIEIIKPLHNAAVSAKDRLKKVIPNINSDLMSFIYGDYHHISFRNADILYLTLEPTALQIELNRLHPKLSELKKGARFVTTNMPYESPLYQITGNEEYTYRDGKGVRFYHKKIM